MFAENSKEDKLKPAPAVYVFWVFVDVILILPEFLSTNKSLMNIIYEIKDAKIEDGGAGAFYIYLRKNSNKWVKKNNFKTTIKKD